MNRPPPAASIVLAVAGGFATGVAVAALGVDRGPVVMALVPVAAAGLCLALRDPRMAVGGVLVSPSVGLQPVAGGMQVVQALGVLAVGVVVARGLLLRVGTHARPTLLWAGALVTWTLVATIPSEQFLTSVRVDLNVLLGLGLCASSAAAHRSVTDLRLALSCWCVGTLTVVLPALTGVGGMSSQYGGALVQGRLTGPFVQPNEFGCFCMVGLFVALALVLLSPSGPVRVLGAVTMVAGALGLVFSLSRGSWLGTALGLAAVLVLRPSLWRGFAAITAGAVLTAAVLLWATPLSTAAGVVADRVGSLANPTGNPDDRRDLVFSEAARLAVESPWVGYGPGSFKVKAEEADSIVFAYHRLHAHNVLLHVAAEAGFVAVALLLGLTAATAAAVRRTVRGPNSGKGRSAGAAAALGGGCAAVAGQGLVDVTFQNPLLMALLWTLLGLTLAACRPAGTP